MKLILGYLAHVASCKLHEVAVGLLDGETRWGSRWNASVRQRPRITLWDFGPQPITLSDVAPRLAEAIDWGLDRVQHATWIAGILGLARVTKETDCG